jgi:undecaprenyl-diphosphatase
LEPRHSYRQATDARPGSGRDADDAEAVIDAPVEPPAAAYGGTAAGGDDTEAGYVPAHAKAERPTGLAGRAFVMFGLVVLLLAGIVSAVLAAQDAAERQEAGDHLGAADAVVLGLVEGVTEWLPISSTGHLTVTQDLLKIEGDAADSYAIAIQAGAILAVLILFRSRFEGMIRGVQGKDPEGRNTLVAIVVACLPAVLIGLTFEDAIKDNLFGTGPVVAAWFVGGLVILAIARHRRGLDPTAGDPLTALTWRHALIIGCAQSLALWPGVSRSLVTIVAATLLGLSVPAAVEFSFLLGFVTLGGATAYELLSSGDVMLDAYGLAMPLLGLAVAFVSALAAMRWMVGYLQEHSLAIFGWYRIGMALLVGLLLAAGVV